MKVAEAIQTSKAVDADAFSTSIGGQDFALFSILNDHFITTTVPTTTTTASTTHQLFTITSNSQVVVQHIQKVLYRSHESQPNDNPFFQELPNHLQVSPVLMTFQLLQI